MKFQKVAAVFISVLFLSASVLTSCQSKKEELPTGLTYPVEDNGRPITEWIAYLKPEGANSVYGLGGCDAGDGYVMLADSHYDDKPNVGHLVKFDKKGNQVWETTYDSTFLMTVAKINGGYAMYGNTDTKEGETEASKFTVSFVDDNGNKVWDYVFKATGKTGNDWVGRPTVAKNGNILISGHSLANDNEFEGLLDKYPNGCAFIAEFTVDGKLAGMHTYDFGACTVVTVCDDGSMIASGTTYSKIAEYPVANELHTGDNADAMLVKLDKYFNVEWVNVVSSSGDDFGIAAYQTEDGGYIFGGATDGDDGDFSGSPQAAESVPFAAKFSKTGELEWARSYSMGEDGEGAWINSFDKTADGRYILAGATYSGNYEEHYGVMVVIKENGNLDFNRLYASVGEENINHAYGSSDGGMFTSGSGVSSSGQKGASMVKYAKIP